MKASDIADLVGRECVVIESGRGMIVRCLGFSDKESGLQAELEIIHPSVFKMNFVRREGAAAIADWEFMQRPVGTVIQIFQPTDQVFRSPRNYLQFSSPYGGTRLFFIDAYVEKVRQRDGDAWEWEDLQKAAS